MTISQNDSYLIVVLIFVSSNIGQERQEDQEGQEGQEREEGEKG